jgi:hypothetical protein
MPAPSKRPLHGRNALEQLLRGKVLEGRPILFLDLDGVLCHGGGYDSYNVNAQDPPSDLWAAESTQVLLSVVAEYQPQVVISSSWQRVLDREQFVCLLRLTGLSAVATALHQHWCSPQYNGESRHRAVEKWLHAHYVGGRLAVLDDSLSGTGLHGSRIDRIGCVVMCDPSLGLRVEHHAALRQALGAPEG